MQEALQVLVDRGRRIGAGAAAADRTSTPPGSRAAARSRAARPCFSITSETPAVKRSASGIATAKSSSRSAVERAARAAARARPFARWPQCLRLVSRVRSVSSRWSRARSRSRRAALTARRKSQAVVPGGGGGATYSLTAVASSPPSRSREAGSICGSRPRYWRTASVEPDRQRGEVGRAAHAGERRRHRRRGRQGQPDPVAHDVGAGGVVAEPLAARADQGAEEGRATEEDVDLDDADQGPHERRGGRRSVPRVVAHRPEPDDQLAERLAAGQRLDGGREHQEDHDQGRRERATCCRAPSVWRWRRAPGPGRTSRARTRAATSISPEAIRAPRSPGAGRGRRPRR